MLWPSRGCRSASGRCRSSASTATSASITPSPARTPSTSGASLGFWRHDSVGRPTSSAFAGIPALPPRPAALRRRCRRRALAGPPRDRARSARGNRAHDRRRKRRAARVRAPDADARALHVPRARRLRPADLPAAAPARVRGALGRSSCSISGTPYAFFNTRWHVQGFQLQPVVRLALRRVRRPTRGRRRSGPLASPRSRSSSRGAGPLGRDLVPPRALACADARLQPPRRLRPASQPPRGRSHRSTATGATAHAGGPLALLGAHVPLRPRDPPRRDVKPAQYLNDSAFHLQMVRWAGGQIREGGVPLDGWYPYLSLGSSFFHHYQSLPHTLTALAAT